MNKADVLALLEANRNEKGIQAWTRTGAPDEKLKSYGIGLTVLRKLAKEIGSDHSLAMELWESDVYDAKLIALLIDDPKRVTREQAEAQVDQLEQGHLAHVFSSCDATLAKAPFVVEIASEWIQSKDPMRRRCGYGLLYEVSKSKKKSAPDDDFFLARIEHIRQTFSGEERAVNHAMGVALMGMGMRNPNLHAAALQVAKEMGPLSIDSNHNKPGTFDVAQKLTNEHVTKKLGL